MRLKIVYQPFLFYKRKIMQSKQPSVSIPQYNAPTPTNFNTPYGSLNYANGSYNYSSSNPSSDAEIASLRDALGSSLAATGPSGVANTQSWQDAYTAAALKNSAPQLSNQLFNAGLGGSSAYANAMGDLYSNTAQNAVLNGQQLNLANTQSNQNSFNAVNSAYGQNQQYALNLAQMGAQYNQGQQQLAQQLYGMQLPYQATLNPGSNNGALGGTIGGIAGGLGGFMLGGPGGAMAGYQIGSGLGSTIGGGNATTGGNQAMTGLNSLYGAGFGSPSPLQNAGMYNNVAPSQYKGNTNGLSFTAFK